MRAIRREEHSLRMKLYFIYMHLEKARFIERRYKTLKAFGIESNYVLSVILKACKDWLNNNQQYRKILEHHCRQFSTSWKKRGCIDLDQLDTS
jgi:hypothetical protein